MTYIDEQPVTVGHSLSLTDKPQRPSRVKVQGLLDMFNVEHFSDFDSSWREDALCKNDPSFITEDFFYVSITRKNISKVLALQDLCQQCPVAANCLHEAFMFNYDGSWAGYSNQQRTQYIRFERNNTVEGLTVAECQEILDHMNQTLDSPVPRSAKVARYKVSNSVHIQN